MAYYEITFSSGKKVTVEADSWPQATRKAVTENPGEGTIKDLQPVGECDDIVVL